MKQRGEPFQEIVQSFVQNTETEGTTQTVEESIDRNCNTTQNDTCKEMKNRREQLQRIVQSVTKEIVQNKAASQIAEQNGIGSTRVEENGDSKSNTMKNIVTTRIEEHTRATRNEEMKKMREQLRGILQNVTKDIVQNKGAFQIAKQNRDDGANVDRESTTPKSIGSMQAEEMNDGNHETHLAVESYDFGVEHRGTSDRKDEEEARGITGAWSERLRRQCSEQSEDRPQRYYSGGFSFEEVEYLTTGA